MLNHRLLPAQIVTFAYQTSWIALGLLLSCATHAAKIGTELAWPTPNDAFLQGKPARTYLQPTVSGRVESGAYGCTRNSGNKFHEGIDLKAVHRNAKGIAVDKIFCIADGIVTHISAKTADSNFGKYVVVQHQSDGLEWCSLYAHLRSIQGNIRKGTRIKAGQVLGVMGNTSSNIEIPESRAHLHLEIGFRLNSYFDRWYAKQDYKTPNLHGSWNGINFLGIDPLDFFRYHLDHPSAPISAYFLNQPPSFEILQYHDSIPDFLNRNPGFLHRQSTSRKGNWYLVEFTWFGLPSKWSPIDSSHIDKRFQKDQFYIRTFKHEKACRSWIDEVNGEFEATRILKRHLEILSQK